MRINNNIMAMNTYRQLGIGTAAGAKSMEKLSSGYRINRAGDDAAGLAISEKMRGQIRGLTQASRNAQDGISMIQTAEGALQETHAILQRMRELAVQSANGTNEDADRRALQDEINQLLSEIDRIAETTEFNKQSLLKGDGGIELAASGLVAGATFTPGTDVEHVQAKAVVGFEGTVLENTKSLTVKLNGVDLTVEFVSDDTLPDNSAQYDPDSGVVLFDDVSGIDPDIMAGAVQEALQAMIDSNEQLKGNYEAVITGDNNDEVTIQAVAGGEFDGVAGAIYVTTDIAGDPPSIDLSGAHGISIPATAASYTIDLTGFDGTAVDALIGTGFSLEGIVFEFYNANDGAYEGDAVGINVSDAYASGVTVSEVLADALAAQLNGVVDGISVAVDENDANKVIITAGETGAASSLSFTDGATVNEEFSTVFQIGANATQTMQVTINDMRTVALKIDGVDISTAAGAESAITTIDAAIAAVSDERAKLGAFQNRLEHTIRNLDTSAENLQASESRIRDVDMAKEMMEFTKNSILQQAATAMLAQANQAPQTVLQLLR